MKVYNDPEDIKTDLKELELRRKIALEKLKLLGHETKNTFKPSNLTNSSLMSVGKVGLLFLIKKLFKKR